MATDLIRFKSADPPLVERVGTLQSSHFNSIQSLVLGLWSLVLGLWFLVFGGVWSLVLGLWSLVFGPWYLALGLWSLVFGLWSLVFGLWPLAVLIFLINSYVNVFFFLCCWGLAPEALLRGGGANPPQ